MERRFAQSVRHLLTFVTHRSVSGVLFAVALMAPRPALSVCANPEPFVLEQPDGATFTARLRGDEWLNWTETVGGYPITRDEPSGTWVYAADPAGVSQSPLVVGRDAPAGVPRSSQWAAARRLVAPHGGPRNPSRDVQPAPPTMGSHPLLVVVVDFTPSISRGVTEKEFQQHFFTGGGTYTPTSVKHYWETVSSGGISLAPASESYGTRDDGIVFVTLGTANPNCGDKISDCNRMLAHDAIVASDPFVDYASFDTNKDRYLNTNELHVFIVVRGDEGSYAGTTCGVPSTWAHAWSLGWQGTTAFVAAPTVDGVVVADFRGAPVMGAYRGGYVEQGEWHRNCPRDSQGHPATIGGAAVHELGHDLGTGMPDLYDIDSSSHGIGRWGVMAGGSWNTTTAAGGYPGQVPAWPEAYSRWWFGILTPTQLVSPVQALQVSQAETAGGADGGVYRLPGGAYTHWNWNAPGEGEYFLIENRQLTGYDAGLPGHGILIWHIYEPANPVAPNADEGTQPPGGRRLVVLEQADGRYDLECYGSGECTNYGDATDPWRIGTATTFDDASKPNSRNYSGTASGLSITNIGSSGAVMTIDVSTACGNKQVDAGEQCDDGNTVNGDGCDVNCSLTDCGNDVATAGEDCDGSDLAGATCASVGAGSGDLACTSTCGIDTAGCAFSKQEQTCRKEIRKHLKNFFKATLVAMETCVDGVNTGVVAPPCPDPQARATVVAATTKVDPIKIGKKCPAEVLRSVGLTGSCATATTAQELASCLVADVEAAVDSALAVEYARPDAVLETKAEQKCQAALGKEAGKKYAVTRLGTLSKCLGDRDNRKVASCPDTKALDKLHRAGAAATRTIAKKCSDAVVQTLNTGHFAASCAAATTVATVTDCELAEHDAIADGLLGIRERGGRMPARGVGIQLSVAAVVRYAGPVSDASEQVETSRTVKRPTAGRQRRGSNEDSEE